jgi:hypothetical protein
MVEHKGCTSVCNDKCYCEDLADDDECECNGIPPLHDPHDDFSFIVTADQLYVPTNV